MKYIYVVLSATPSKFGKLIRFTLHTDYNHMSIALDGNLDKLYSFARKKNELPLDGGLVEENYYRFSLCRDIVINCRIYKIPVSKYQYIKLVRKINAIKDDSEYIYNLYSALSFPVSGGFSLNKAFTCVEFVAYLLKYIGIQLSKKPYMYSPTSLGLELEPYLCYEGDLAKFNNFKENSKFDPSYFEDINKIRFFSRSSVVLYKVTKRTIRKLYSFFVN